MTSQLHRTNQIIIAVAVIFVDFTARGYSQDLKLPEPLYKFKAESESLNCELHFSDLGSLLTLLNSGKPPQVWNLKSLAKLSIHLPFVSNTGQAALSTRDDFGILIASKSETKAVVGFSVVRLRHGTQVKLLECNSPTQVASAACFSGNDNQYLVTATSTHPGTRLTDRANVDEPEIQPSLISLWDFEEFLKEDDRHERVVASISSIRGSPLVRVQCVVFREKTNQVAALCEYGGVSRVVFLTVPGLLPVIDYQTDRYHSRLAIADSGETFATAGSFLLTLSLNQQLLQDNKSLLSAEIESDRRILVWNTLASGEARMLVGHRMGVLSISFLRGANFLISSGLDERLILWDVKNARISRCFQCSSIINAISVSDDNDFVAASFQSGDVMVWRTSELFDE